MRVVLLLWALAHAGLAAGPSQASPELKSELVGQVLALRQPLRGSEIIFHPGGHPVPPLVRGSFGRDALLHVEDLRVSGPNLELRGRRAILLATSPREPLQFVTTDERLKVIVVLPSLEAEEVRRALAQVFRDQAAVQAIVAAYAAGFTREGMLEPDRPVVRCRLRAIARPMPYGVANGRMVARLILNEDGEPESIAVVSGPRSRDDMRTFISTLWNWRFAPARKKGRPAACSATIGMTFARRMR